MGCPNDDVDNVDKLSMTMILILMMMMMMMMVMMTVMKVKVSPDVGVSSGLNGCVSMLQV